MIGPCTVAVQAGLLTPLTFAQHHLSPLAAFTSNVYFLHSGRWWQWICKFYTANFKDIFGGPYSECVWQQAVTCCSCYRNLGCPKTHFSMNSWSSGQPRNDAKTLVFHPLSLVIFATTTVVAFVLLRNSRFNFHCYTQHEANPTQKSARKWCYGLLQLLVQKITKGTIRANQLHWTAQYSTFCT